MEQENLPTELILDILSRLSVKTLVRLRSVSRAWLSLISDHFFKHLHRERSQKKKVIHLKSSHDHNCSCDVLDGMWCIDHLYTYMEADECLLEDELVFVDIDKIGSYILSSNGGSLLCYVTKYDILVCNPSSRELLTLPRGTQYFRSFFFQGIIPDPPRQYSHEGMIGFAYLYVKNEYKIVRLFYKRQGREYFNDFEVGCEILTLRDGDDGGDGWRLVDEEFCPYPIYYTVPPVVNQALHWLVHYDYWYGYMMQFPDVVDERIVTFNVMTEKFNVVSTPPYLSDVDLLELMELRGFLALTSAIPRTSEMDLWVLKDYDTKLWVKEYVIDLSRMDNFEITDIDNVVPYYISDVEMLICCDEERLDSYNIKTQCCRNLIKDNNWKPSKMKYCKWNQLELKFYQDGFFSLARSTLDI